MKKGKGLSVGGANLQQQDKGSKDPLQ